MRSYSGKITLAENSRGVWSLDTVMGCKTGMKTNKKGCFSDCYAARNARIYGYNFTENILRRFENEKHLESIKMKINRLEFPFVRVGNSGDPSENWDHTIKTLELLKDTDKEMKIFMNRFKCMKN